MYVPCASKGDPRRDFNLTLCIVDPEHDWILVDMFFVGIVPLFSIHVLRVVQKYVSANCCSFRDSLNKLLYILVWTMAIEWHKGEIVLEIHVSSVAHALRGLQKKHGSPIQSLS